MNKILGYILLGIGILLIVVPLIQTYHIFTGKSQPPELFTLEPIQPAKPNNSADIQQQFLEKALLTMMPISSMNKSLNLASWILLAWTFIIGGSKLAGLGIALAKE